MTGDPVGAGLAGALLDGAGVAVVAFFIVWHTAAAALLLRALLDLWGHWDLAEEAALVPVLASEALPTVSVVVTGATDGASTIDAVRSLLALTYPRHEVVLVHDAAASGQLPHLLEAFDLYQVPPAVLVNVPTGVVRGYYRSRRHGKLFVLDKGGHGPADDLNAALNASRFPYILTMHIGTSLEPDALRRLMRPFLIGQRVAAVAGTVRVSTGHRAREEREVRTHVPTDWLSGVQVVECLREAMYLRMGWNRLGGLLQTQQTVLLHRRDHLLAVDGFRGTADDPALDLIVRLRRHLRAQRQSDAVPVIPEPVAWAPAVTSARQLARTREPAYAAQLQVLRAHRGSLLTTRAGASRVLAPLHLLAIAVLAPVLELAGYLVLLVTLIVRGARDPFVPLFIVAVPGFALLLSLWAIALEAASARRFASWRALLRLCAFAAAEQLGYRQWLLWSRLRALTRALRGRHDGDPQWRAPEVAVEDAHSARERVRAR